MLAVGLAGVVVSSLALRAVADVAAAVRASAGAFSELERTYSNATHSLHISAVCMADLSAVGANTRGLCACDQRVRPGTTNVDCEVQGVPWERCYAPLVPIPSKPGSFSQAADWPGCCRAWDRPSMGTVAAWAVIFSLLLILTLISFGKKALTHYEVVTLLDVSVTVSSFATHSRRNM